MTDRNNQMTIKQLIAELSKYDENMCVVTSGYEGGFADPCIRPIKIVRNVNTEWYYGAHDEPRYSDKAADIENAVCL